MMEKFKEILRSRIESALDEGYAKHIPLTSDYLAEKLISIFIADYESPIVMERLEAAGIKVYDLKYFKRELNEQLTDIPFTKEASYDVELPLEAIDFDLAQQAIDFSLLSGKNCPPITFVIRNLKPNEFTIMKDKHTKFTINDITFLMWNNTEIPLLYDNVHDSLTVAGTLEISYFRGQKSVNFIIQDYRIELYDIFI